MYFNHLNRHKHHLYHANHFNYHHILKFIIVTFKYINYFILNRVYIYHQKFSIFL